jgi:hypothetical protein
MSSWHPVLGNKETLSLIHIFSHEGEQWNNRFYFLKLLQDNPRIAEQYAELKMHLAKKKDYTENKSHFVAAATLLAYSRYGTPKVSEDYKKHLSMNVNSGWYRRVIDGLERKQ